MKGSIKTKPQSGIPTKISASNASKIVRDAKIYPGEIQDFLKHVVWCGFLQMHNKEALEERWAIWSSNCEKSHYYANTTKYPAFNEPNSTETNLKPSWTQ